MYKSRKKYQKKRIRKKFIIISLIPVALAAAIIIFLSIKPSDTIEQQLEMSFKLGDVFSVNAAGVSYVSSEKFCLSDFRAQTIWDNMLYLSSGNDNIKLNNSEKLFCAYDNTAVQVSDVTGKQLTPNRATGTIEFIRAGLTRIAYVTKELKSIEEEISKVVVADSEGVEIAAFEFPEIVMDCGFYGKNEKLWVLVLDISGSIPISKIITYDTTTKTVTGTIELTDQLIENVVVDDENIYACGTTYLNIYTFLCEKKDSIFIYGWKYAKSYVIDSAMYFAYVPRESEEEGMFSAMKIIREGKSATQINLQESCQQIIIQNKMVYCISQKNVWAYTLDGVFDHVSKLPISFDKILMAANGYIYAAKGEVISQVPIK